jgi:RNA polymerase sigma-70 factor, ECF subfamily
MDEFAGTLGDALVRPEPTLARQFEAGLAQWSSLAFRVAYSVLRQREDAEDVAQDALAKAYSRLRQLRDADRLRAWLVRMAWRLAINRRESDRRRRHREGTATEPVGSGTVEHDALAAERAERLWAAIDSLPDRLRMVVVLASIQEHDLAQVASALAIPEGTVKSRLFEARKLLRERLR